MFPQTPETSRATGNDREKGEGTHNADNRRSRWPRNAAILWLAFCVVWPVAATTLARMNLGQLTARAAVIVRARCAAITPQMDSHGISTMTTFVIVEVWKGRVPQHFAVRLPGGVIGSRRETVEGAPRFAAGEEAVLFLEPLASGDWTIAGWAQGTYRIRHDANTHIERTISDAEGMELFDVKRGTFRAGAGLPMAVSQLHAIVSRLVDGGMR